MEPVTTLTDFLVAIVCWVSYFLITRINNPGSEAFPWFKRYFLIFAIGMTSAAWLGHGLQAYVTPEFKAIGWICGATGLMFLQFGSFQLIKSNLKPGLRKALQVVFVAQWLTAVGFMLYRLNIGIVEAFKVTQINSVVALIVLVLPMHIYAYKVVKISGSKLVIGALAYSAIPGLVYSNQISISRWFNYHDISHVLMAIFMSFMFYGLYSIVAASPES